MSAILSLLTSEVGGWLLAAVGGIATVVFAYLKGSSNGAAKAENKSLKQSLASKDEQLEMHREATAAELEAARLSDEAARKEAEKWAKR